MARTNEQQQRAQLMRVKQEMENRLAKTDVYGLQDSMRDEISELSLADNHPADIASELFEREKDVGLRHLDQVRLDTVNAALQRLDDGMYDRCRQCGKPIGEERLAANPVAILCITCKRHEEGEETDLDRPVEEWYLTPGFARTDLDDNDATGFDGEDSWQAVARYNQRAGYDEDAADHLERSYMDDNEGIVDGVDAISNEAYRARLP